MLHAKWSLCERSTKTMYEILNNASELALQDRLVVPLERIEMWRDQERMSLCAKTTPQIQTRQLSYNRIFHSE